MITDAHATGLVIPPTALNVREAVEKAVHDLVPMGKTKALVGIGRMNGTQFEGELAWVQKINESWSVTAGLSGGTAKPISGQLMLAGSWK